MLSRLATALRAVAAAALVVLASGVAVRAIDAAFDPFQAYPGHTSDYGVARTRAIRAALPAIADRSEKGVIVLGSSGIARAFDPVAFDAAFAWSHGRYASFNLAQLLMQPETALAMAKVIRRTYEARHRRIGIAILGVSVPELTRDALRAARRKMPDQAFAFATFEDEATRAKTDPLGALGDGLELLLYGNIRPERVGLWLEDWARARPSPCESGLKQPPEGAEAVAALVSFCNELHRQFPRGVPPWNPDRRGGFDFGLPETLPHVERLVALQPSSVSNPAPAAGPPPPARDDIDAAAVRTLIAAVRELRVVSDHTFVVRDLMNPAVLAQLPASRLAQWRVVAEQIAHEGEATLIDPNDGSFHPSDFGDRTHLHPLAAERYSSQLAVRLQALVEGSRASR